MELSSLGLISVPDYFADDAEEAFALFFDDEGAFPAVAVEPVYALDGNVFVVTLTNDYRISSNNITILSTYLIVLCFLKEGFKV